MRRAGYASVGIFALCLAVLGFSLAAAQESSITTPNVPVLESQNCPSVLQSLRNLQKLDSKTRVYLGGKYEHLIAKLITPLNIALVKQSKLKPILADYQAVITAEREAFNMAFILYSQELEVLIGMNCDSNLSNFAQQLIKVRTQRNLVFKKRQALEYSLEQYLLAVRTLQGEL